MVKKAKKAAAGSAAAKKKRPGRPPIDPGDLRAVRFSFRIHPDLYEEVRRLGRIRGQHASIVFERAAIAEVNKSAGGKPVLNEIGRYNPEYADRDK